MKFRVIEGGQGVNPEPQARRHAMQEPQANADESIMEFYARLSRQLDEMQRRLTAAARR